MSKKIYIIIIVVLLLIVAFLAYNQFFKTKQPNTGTNYGDLGKAFKGDLMVGNDKAPVTIIEYYSYLCTHCKTFEDQTMPKITEQYIVTGKVKLIFRPFPPYELGQAVLCANDQGKFLELHNYFFANSSQITSVDIIKTFAQNVGLDTTKFNQCFDSGKYKSRTEELYAQGNSDFQKANIASDQQGTPTFFVNGEVVIGAVPYDDFSKIIEKKLGN